MSVSVADDGVQVGNVCAGADSACIDADDMFETNSVEDMSWVKYAERQDWRDVVPCPQDDGPVPVVRIAYSDKFVDVYDYFRAVLHSGEVSLRALRLTAAALELNPANYTVWHHRRHLLAELGYPLHTELQFVRRMIEDHPKNYQVWHHRKVLVERQGVPGDELRLTEIVLNQDAKNFHAWQYRQWAVRRFNLFAGELSFSERLISEDVRNNSAWNQRYFVVANVDGFTEEVIAREVNFCTDAIRKVKRNESAWNYMRGVLSHATGGLASDRAGALLLVCDGFLDAGCRAPQLMAFVVDVAAAQAEQGQLAGTRRALRLCTQLAEQHDAVRAQYWMYRRRTLLVRYGSDEHYEIESKESEAAGDTAAEKCEH